MEKIGTKISDWILSVEKIHFKRILVILIVLDFILLGHESILQKIHIGDFDGYYQTYLEFRQFIPKEAGLIAKHLAMPFVLLTIVDFIFLIWKRKYILVSLCSLSPELGNINISKKNRRISKRCLNLCSEMHKNNVQEAVIKTDDFIADIQRQRGNAELGIYGIMHTPLLFRIGFDIGDQSNVDLYHKKRTNDSCFEIWDEHTQRYDVNFSEENNDVNSTEMIVAISTSLKIENSDISCLKPESKHVLRFTGISLDFDSLLNFDDATKIRDKIMREIREKSKKYDIQKIHMVISSSVAFTIFLGMAYSKQHDPECIVYHYERYQINRYPWGISILSPAENCFVSNEASESALNEQIEIAESKL